MTLLVVQVKPESIVIDLGRYPDHDSSHIYEHLKYCCSKNQPIPAITVTVEEDGPVVIEGHKYLRAACELGHESIRAILRNDSGRINVSQFLKSRDVKQLDWSAIEQEERNNPIIKAWHIFFFDTAIDDTQVVNFKERVAGFFEHLDIPLLQEYPQPRVVDISFPMARICGEFQAMTPVADESWYAEFLATCRAFSNECVRIISYQGSKFRG